MATILVVDDSTVARNTLKMMLTAGGHQVVAEAINGFQAYGEYRRYLPELITMDLTMPKMDGLEAIETIINEFPKAKIVVISSWAQKKMVLMALEKGAQHYLIKPLEQEKVLGVINQVLDQENKD